MLRDEIRRAAMCNGKQQHSRNAANRVVRETKKVKLDAYRCKFCGYWHVGQKEKGK